MALCAIFDLSLNIASGLPAVGHGLRENNNLKECKCGRKYLSSYISSITDCSLSLSQALPLTFTVQQLFFYSTMQCNKFFILRPAGSIHSCSLWMPLCLNKINISHRIPLASQRLRAFWCTLAYDCSHLQTFHKNLDSVFKEYEPHECWFYGIYLMLSAVSWHRDAKHWVIM